MVAVSEMLVLEVDPPSATDVVLFNCVDWPLIDWFALIPEDLFHQKL